MFCEYFLCFGGARGVWVGIMQEFCDFCVFVGCVDSIGFWCSVFDEFWMVG